LNNLADIKSAGVLHFALELRSAESDRRVLRTADALLFVKRRFASR
jgi:hypothetical protein